MKKFEKVLAAAALLASSASAEKVPGGYTPETRFDIDGNPTEVYARTVTTVFAEVSSKCTITIGEEVVATINGEEGFSSYKLEVDKSLTVGQKEQKLKEKYKGVLDFEKCFPTGSTLEDRVKTLIKACAESDLTEPEQKELEQELGRIEAAEQLDMLIFEKESEADWEDLDREKSFEIRNNKTEAQQIEILAKFSPREEALREKQKNGRAKIEEKYESLFSSLEGLICTKTN